MRSKKSVDWHLLYLTAFRNAAVKYAENTSQDIISFAKQMIFYGIKAVNTKPEPKTVSRKEAESDFQFISIIKDLVALLKPGEFMTIFPITKEYDGLRYGTKDYFYTMEHIQQMDMNQCIGEAALEFLWDYCNIDVWLFNVNVSMAMSRLRQLDGHPSLAEEWAEMNGIQTFRSYEGANGQKFFIDKNGKTIRTKKPRPKHLKIVKRVK